jgi:hypothetical protein
LDEEGGIFENRRRCSISDVLSDARRDTDLRRCGWENKTPSLGRGAVSGLFNRLVLAPSSIAQLAFGCGAP